MLSVMLYLFKCVCMCMPLVTLCGNGFEWIDRKERCGVLDVGWRMRIKEKRGLNMSLWVS